MYFCTNEDKNTSFYLAVIVWEKYQVSYNIYCTSLNR